VGKRRKGREIVLQSMYASLTSGAQLMDTLEDQLAQRESADETADFARDLSGKVKAHGADLDRWLNTLISSRWDPSLCRNPPKTPRVTNRRPIPRKRDPRERIHP